MDEDGIHLLAALAMNALITNGSYPLEPAKLAMRAYDYAEAMVKEGKHRDGATDSEGASN